MKRLIVNVLSAFILSRSRRNAFRRAVMFFRFRDVFAAWRFGRESCRENSVLLVEENTCHGEVISGYIRYFRQLGFNVDILLNSALLDERPFCRQDMEGVNVYHCYFGGFCAFLSRRRLLDYRHVVLMTSVAYRFINGQGSVSMLQAQPVWRRIRSLFVVEHDLRNVECYGEGYLVDENRLLVLGRFPRGVFVCPSYLGKVSVTPKSAITTFVSVGAIAAFRKDHGQLFSAIAELDAKGCEFKVVVIGQGNVGNLPASVSRHLEFTGRLDFPAMFDRVESADFYLPLLNRANPDHERYVTTGVTGSAQLIYAFAKVPVIDPHFASFYGFDQDNAILAEDLTAAMSSAIAMTSAEYDSKQRALIRLADSLREQSLNNLRSVLNR